MITGYINTSLRYNEKFYFVFFNSTSKLRIFREQRSTICDLIEIIKIGLNVDLKFCDHTSLSVVGRPSSILIRRSMSVTNVLRISSYNRLFSSIKATTFDRIFTLSSYLNRHSDQQQNLSCQSGYLHVVLYFLHLRHE